jgi:hypothetical protein
MKYKRLILIFTWEVIRILLLLAAVSALFEKVLFPNQGGIFWLVLLSAGALLYPAFTLLLYFRFSQYSPLLPLFLIGKIIAISPCFLLLLFELNRKPPFILNFIFLPFSLGSPLFLFTILVIDLLFLAVILSFKE